MKFRALRKLFLYERGVCCRSSSEFCAKPTLERGPLWKPLRYAQIGGLTVATFITLLLVPVFYSFFVLDLKWIKWEPTENREEIPQAETTTA